MTFFTDYTGVEFINFSGDTHTLRTEFELLQNHFVMKMTVTNDVIVTTGHLAGQIFLGFVFIQCKSDIL